MAAMEIPPVIPAHGKKPRGSLLRTLAVLLFAGFGCFVLLAYLAMPRPPKESAVIQNFYRNRSVFEHLRDMLKEDTHLSRVAAWGVETRSPFYLGDASGSSFPMDRYRSYLALLKQAGGCLASRDEGEHGDLNIVVWAWGWAGNTRHMGVSWMEETPTNQISALDYRQQSQSPERRLAFKHIDQNWYLWTDF